MTKHDTSDSTVSGGGWTRQQRTAIQMGGNGSLTYKSRATKTNPNSTASWIKEPNVKYFHKKIQEYARFPKEDTRSTNYK